VNLWTLKPQRTQNALQQQKSENDVFKESLSLFVFFCGFSVQRGSSRGGGPSGATAVMALSGPS
jgi:hypothetical protein